MSYYHGYYLLVIYITIGNEYIQYMKKTKNNIANVIVRKIF